MNEENSTPEKETEEKTHAHKEGKITKKMRENPWILSTFVLGVLALILLIGNFPGMTGGVITGGAVDEGVAGDVLVKLAKEQIGDIEILNVEQESGLYRISYSSEQGEGIVYMTLDGKNLVMGVQPLNQPQQTTSPESTFTEEQNILIQKFSSCLYENGMRVYYAGWCSACHKFIEIFGGLENMGPMMVECQTESRQSGEGADLCAVENISAFPTIKINGEKYSGGSWAFEAFAEATGCPAPQLD